ncbi:MAG: transcriptional regulator [Sphingobacteriales bacterium]|nr:MAG: transcriptional regulator [Sphingobacteriales bacterium]
MNHKLRHTILTFIDNACSTNVTAIYKTLNIEQAVASQHLAIMRRAKIVTATRTGKQILYSVNHERINHYMIKVKEILA